MTGSHFRAAKAGSTYHTGTVSCAGGEAVTGPRLLVATIIHHRRGWETLNSPGTPRTEYRGKKTKRGWAYLP